LAAANWAESVSPGVLIKAAHIVELRARLDEARAALGLSATSYTDPTLTAGVTAVKAVHIQELRQRVTEALTASFAIPVDGHANLAYDLMNRITTAGFAYDAAGNQVRAPIAGGASQRFQYDAANRLVKVKADDNVTVLATYTYGDSNERLIVDEGGLRTYYACDASAEYVESGGSTTPLWSKSYIYLGARLLSTLTPNGAGGETVQHHHPDRLGTRLVTDPSSGTSFEQITLPFGTALNAESTGATNRRFTSYNRSTVTGLDYANNRHYDPQQGRFTQVDPIGMGSVSLTSPQTLNLYAYCLNDPINQIDPSGLGFFSFLGKLFKAIGKVIKILAVVLVVVVVVALVIAYAAPAGSMAISFAKFLLFKLAPVLAKTLAGLTGFQTGSITLGPGGTPTWNPNSRGSQGFGGFGWDDDIDVITTTTSCRNNWPAPDGPNCPGAPWYKKVWREVVGGIAVAIALGQVSYGRLAALEQRFGMWFLKRMDEGSPKVQIGTYKNGDPIYVGFAVGGLEYSPQVVAKGAADTLFHGFPTLVDQQVLQYGQRTVISDSYVQYTLRGSISGGIRGRVYQGTYQIGVNPATNQITHRFFKPD
jgi:RHS repeat-associated protein